MYWQVYLHKTVVAGDHLLKSVIRRVRWHLGENRDELVNSGSEAFLFFLRKGYSSGDLHREDIQDAYVALDDTDIIFSLKNWQLSDDRILADLSRRILVRDFFRVDFDVDNSRFAEPEIQRRIGEYLIEKNLSDEDHLSEDISYYLHRSHSTHEAYDTSEDTISVLNRSGIVEELSVSEDGRIVSGLAERQIRSFICYPKEVGP